MGVLPIFLAMILISGCGSENIPKKDENEIKVESEDVFSREKEKNQEIFPPTGKIDDIIRAIDYEIEEENRILSDEENDAKNSVAIENETDYFGEVYD